MTARHEVRSGGLMTSRRRETEPGSWSTVSDEWCKALAPSTGLRQWYSHNPERFEEFGRRCRAELREPERAEALERLQDLARHGNLRLITATKNADISEAAVLADLPGRPAGGKPPAVMLRRR